MKRPINIFVNAQESMDLFLDELEQITNLEFQHLNAEQDVYYEFRDDVTRITVGTHTFENDRDLNFEDYNIDIEINLYNVSSEAKQIQLRGDLGNRIFDQLKDTGKYDLMLVDGHWFS